MVEMKAIYIFHFLLIYFYLLNEILILYFYFCLYHVFLFLYSIFEVFFPSL
jgi:hypothetical protein